MSVARPTTPRCGRRGGAGLSPAAAAGFSLVEVLIAVLILALGLLGLGAVFPVIVREQKLGSDIITGTVAGNSARALLQGMNLTHPNVGGPNFWREIRAELDHPDYEEGQWPPPDFYGTDLQSGEAVLLNNAPNAIKIPMRMRLYPFDAPGAAPQFVWDIAVQRVWDGDGILDNDDLRVAFFVRRIDPRIRVPQGMSLSRALSQRAGLPQSNWRVPVAEDLDGAPTYDGMGTATPRYSRIRTVNVVFDYNANGPADRRRRDRLYAATGQANRIEWRLARQPNQKLIDNLGNVYTVLEAGRDGNREFVRISPEVPAFVTNEGPDPMIVQVAFTPQVAAAIVTWRITP